MKKLLVLIASFMIFTGTVFSQEEQQSAWQTLGKVTFKKQFDDLLGFKIDIPVFSETVRAIDGDEIELRGYIVPTNGYKSHTEFVFSAFPYNMCFFCGGAGPETVVEVETAEPVEYTADPITIRGILTLNDSDPNRLMYALSATILVEE